MSVEQNDRIDDLRVAVTRLNQALSVSEQRTARLERIIRWGVLGIGLALGLTITAALQPLGYALTQPGTAPSKSVEEAIDRLNQSLTGPQSTFGQMGMMMQSMMTSVARRTAAETMQMPTSMQKNDCSVVVVERQPGWNPSKEIKQARTDYPLGYYAKCYFLENDIKPQEKGGYSDDHYQAAVVSAMGGMAVEMGVLVHRVRYASDFVHNIGALIDQALIDKLTPRVALEAVSQELKTLNNALASVPQMAANMTIMAQQMGVMTNDMTAMTYHMGNMNYSMGSTMGRMGNWMP